MNDLIESLRFKTILSSIEFGHKLSQIRNPSMSESEAIMDLESEAKAEETTAPMRSVGPVMETKRRRRKSAACEDGSTCGKSRRRKRSRSRSGGKSRKGGKGRKRRRRKSKKRSQSEGAE